MSATIERALETVTTIDASKADSVALAARGRIDRLNKIHASLLPIEHKAMSKVYKEILEAQRLRDMMEFVAKHPKYNRMLSKEPLTWRQHIRVRGRNTGKVPTLALIPLGSKRITFTDYGIDYVQLPQDLNVYKDVFDSFRAAKGRRVGSIYATFEFDGVIPDETRALIKEAAETHAFNPHSMYLLVEAPKDRWQIKDETRRPPIKLLDPIVLGHRAETLWVIDHFDPTPVEQHILDEFVERLALPVTTD